MTTPHIRQGLTVILCGLLLGAVTQTIADDPEVVESPVTTDGTAATEEPETPLESEIFSETPAADAEPASIPDATASEQIAFIIPVEGEINQSLVYLIRRGISEAKTAGAQILILDMDTPGGRVDSTRKIMTALLAAGDELRTITYVNTWAMSAGSFISVCTDDIFMAPVSQIGAAAPIIGTEEVSDTVNEKMVSAVAALARSAAEAKGHDPKLIEAMVRMDMEYKIGDDVIARDGELLTLTNTEAEKKYGDPPRPLLSAGTVKDIDELLARIGVPDARQIRMSISTAERFSSYIESLSVFLLSLGILMLYFEAQSPTFGLLGILGISLIGIWFWAYAIAGSAGAAELLIFIIGLALLAVEVFVIPGFGFVGVLGVACMLGALMMAMVPHIPTNVPGLPPFPVLPDLYESFVRLGLSLVLSTISMLILARYLPETRLFSRLVLEAATDAKSGYTASENTRALIGQTGVSVTPLRPGGTGDFAGTRMSVVSRGEFIDSNSLIRIAEAHGSRIVVEAVAGSEA